MSTLLQSVLLAILFSVSTADYKCGPQLKCVCQNVTDVSMNCSNRQITLCDVCRNALNVTTLDISMNDVRELPISCVANCANLRSLTARYCSIKRICGRSGVILNNLQNLDVSCNLLHSLYTGKNNSADMFAYFPSLTTLRINNNLGDQKEVTYPNFSFLNKLETLYLDGLNRQSFGDSYSKLHNLNSVVMSGFQALCNLNDLQNSTFQNIRNIVRLDISKCNITNVRAGVFEKLAFLEYLDISHNPLGFAPLRNVSYGLQFTNIKIMNYSKVYQTFGIGTTLQLRDICYLRNTTLRQIVLDSNRLSFIQPNALLLFPKSLKTLYVCGNKISFGAFIFQFRCLENLEELYMDENNYERDPMDYFREEKFKPRDEVKYSIDCPFMQKSVLINISVEQECPFVNASLPPQYPQVPKRLRKISLTQSNMRYVIKKINFSALDNVIETVDASKNTLYSWQGPIEFPQLKHLDLSDNHCSNASGTFFSSMASLETLQVTRNLLGLVSKQPHATTWFQGLYRLKKLDLSMNAIRHLPSKIFEDLISLEILDLSHNRMVAMEVDTTNLKNLQFLNLGYNFITVLSVNTLNNLQTISVRLNGKGFIDLRNNPLECSCKNNHFIQWAVEHKTSLVHFRKYKFYDKDRRRLRLQEVLDFVTDVTRTCGTFTLLIVFSCLGLSVYMTVVIGGIAFRYRWKLRYYFYLTRFRLKANPKDESNRMYMYDAFISYAEENDGFIRNVLATILEERGISLCLHQRDFRAGIPIVDNIVDAIQNSRKTVVILSKDYLRRRWCMYEFQMARMESIYSRDEHGCLLVVLLEDIPLADMQLEMLQWVQTGSYLEHTSDTPEVEAHFWQRLEEAIRR